MEISMRDGCCSHMSPSKRVRIILPGMGDIPRPTTTGKTGDKMVPGPPRCREACTREFGTILPATHGGTRSAAQPGVSQRPRTTADADVAISSSGGGAGPGRWAHSPSPGFCKLLLKGGLGLIPPAARAPAALILPLMGALLAAGCAPIRNLSQPPLLRTRRQRRERQPRGLRRRRVRKRPDSVAVGQ